MMLQMIFSYPTRGLVDMVRGERLVRQTVGASCIATSVGASRRWARLILAWRQPAPRPAWFWWRRRLVHIPHPRVPVLIHFFGI